MSLKDKASLIFKPSRYKAGTAYSFRGTDFTFTRASAATRVNASGLIEDVASGVPRLSYDPTDLTKDPSLKLELSRTNLVSQSQDFTAWSKHNCSVTSNSITGPEGVVNSFKITENSSPSTQHRVSIYIGASSGIYTISVYVKNSVGNRMAYIDMGVVTAHFNFLTETIYSAQGTAGFENAGNGWYRIWVTSNSAITPSCYMGLSVNNNETYSGDGTSAIEFFGAQIEAGAYPTTLIKTSGSAVTRAEDSSRITTLQSSKILSASAGTFMIEADKRQSPLFLNQKITVSGSSTNSSLLIDQAAGAVRLRIWNSSSSLAGTITTDSFSEGTVKYLIKWDGTNTSVFANGKFVGTAAVPNYAYAMYDMYEQTSFSNNNINEVIFLPSALSDADCIALTSFDDYEELVDAKGLTWESPTITNNRLTALREL